MKKKYFIPNGDAQKVVWLMNFNTRLAAYKIKLGLTAAQMTSVNADTLAFIYVVALVESGKTFEKSCTNTKNLLRNSSDTTTIVPFPVYTADQDIPPAVASGIFNRIGTLVKLIKNNAAYTNAMGQDLGIIGVGPESKGATEETTIILSVKISGENVQIKYTKGNLDGIKLESRRGNETDFSLLEKINTVVYIDTRPNLVHGQPEVREYRAWGFVKDKVVSAVSAIVSISANQ